MHNGKPYFHNSKTNQTVWEKPFELLPLEERAALWKEYTVSQTLTYKHFISTRLSNFLLQAPQTGRKYYYNTSTKVTTWTEPAELKEVRDKKAAAETPAEEAAAVAAVVPAASSLASAQAKADAAAGAVDFLTIFVE
jgi:pre-mRNA-processing factor 40